MNELFDPEHELVSRMETLEGGSHRGLTGFQEWRRIVDEMIEQTIYVDTVTPIDADRVLVVAPVSYRFKTSGLGLDEQRFATLATVRDGRVVRSEVYPSEEEARAASRSEV